MTNWEMLVILILATSWALPDSRRCPQYNRVNIYLYNEEHRSSRPLSLDEVGSVR